MWSIGGDFNGANDITWNMTQMCGSLGLLGSKRLPDIPVSSLFRCEKLTPGLRVLNGLYRLIIIHPARYLVPSQNQRILSSAGIRVFCRLAVDVSLNHPKVGRPKSVRGISYSLHAPKCCVSIYITFGSFGCSPGNWPT